MTKYQDIIKRLPKEEIFLENTFEGIAIRSVPGKTSEFYAKFKGKAEYRIDHQSQVVAEALLEAKEISREKYINY
jgi:hypothetical protein